MDKQITINFDKFPKPKESDRYLWEGQILNISEKDVPVKWSEEEIEEFHRRLKEDGLE